MSLEGSVGPADAEEEGKAFPTSQWREEGKKVLLQRWEHRHPKEGPWSQQEEEREREAAKPPSASRLGEWGTWVSGRF